MTEKQLRRLIREELEIMLEEKSPDQKRLEDARLSIISLSTASEILGRIGNIDPEAREIAVALEEMVEKVRKNLVPRLEDAAKGTIASKITGAVSKASDWLRF